MVEIQSDLLDDKIRKSDGQKGDNKGGPLCLTMHGLKAVEERCPLDGETSKSHWVK